MYLKSKRMGGRHVLPRGLTEDKAIKVPLQLSVLSQGQGQTQQDPCQTKQAPSVEGKPPSQPQGAMLTACKIQAYEENNLESCERSSAKMWEAL